MARTLTVPPYALAALPLLATLLASCKTPEFAAEAGYMVMEMAGEFGFAGSGGGGGTANINLGEGLDISNADSPYLKLETSALGFRFELSGFKYSDSGDSILNANFGDIIAGSTVTTDVDMWNLKGTIAYEVLDLGFLRVSPGVSLDYFDVDLDMVATSPIAAFEKIDFRAPVPMPYVNAQLEYGSFTLDAELSGMSANLPDADGLYWDLSTKLRYKPLPLVEVFLGYRYLQIDADGTTDGQDFDADIHLNGLFFGGRISF